MKAEDHMNAYNEHRDTINWSIDRGLKKSQRIIGMHVSRAIVELLSAFLHKKNFLVLFNEIEKIILSTMEETNEAKQK